MSFQAHPFSFFILEWCKSPEEYSTVVFLMGFVFYLKPLKLRFTQGYAVTLTALFKHWPQFHLFLYLDTKLVYTRCPFHALKGTLFSRGIH